MPQFAFNATDNMGNSVEGTIFAGDAAGATQQVQQMGYQPKRVEEANRPIAAGEPTQMLPVWNVANAAPPVPLGGEADTESDADITQRVEPWQRGGPVTPSSVAQPTLTLNAYGNTVPTQRMTAQTMAPPVANPYAGQTGTASSRDVAIPYTQYGERNITFGQRVAETLIYPIISGVVFKELPPFFRQFATLINAGLPLYQALSSLETATTNKKLKEITRAGQKQVEAGGKFSDVMAAYPWIFQPAQIELVRAAEQGGMLDIALRQIADYVEHELEIRRLISRETLYPKIVIFVAIMIIGKSGFTGDMMALVKLVLGNGYTPLNYLGDTIGALLGLLVPIFLTVAVFRLFLFNSSGVREAYDTFKMYVPVTGKITRMFALARFTRTFSTLYRAGFLIPECLRISGDASGNAVLRKFAQRGIRRTEDGGLVSEALADSMLVPPIALNMFKTGETTGNMDQTLDKVADYYEAEGKMKSHQGAIIFGVVVFLIVALMVGSQIVSFYTGGYGGAIQKEMNKGE